jgi:hypothetical protein
MFSSLFWISCPLKMGLLGCPKTSVRNLHFTLCNISEYHSSHKTSWQCRSWFGSARSTSERSGSGLYTQTWNDLTYLSTKFNERVVLHSSKYSTYCMLESRDGTDSKHILLIFHMSYFLYVSLVLLTRFSSWNIEQNLLTSLLSNLMQERNDTIKG